MSNAGRTLSYMKRNGILATAWAVAERKDKKGMDAWQRRVEKYAHAIRPESLFSQRREAGGEPERDAKGKVIPFTKPYRGNAAEPVCVSLLVPAYHTDPVFFREMIESVLGQRYTNWQLVIADASDDDRLESLAESFEDPRITYLHLALNEGISENTNTAFSHAYGDYVGFLDHDDLLAPDALFEVVRLFLEGDYDLVYTDEDKVSADLTRRFEPHFKPAFNLDLLLSNNYICHFTALRASLFEKLLLRKEYDGSQDYDLFLRAVLGIEWRRAEQQGGPEYGLFPAEYMKRRIGHVPRILYHWRTHEASTAANPESKRYAYDAGKRALEDFCRQLDWKAEVEHTCHLGFYRIRYLPDVLSVRKDIWGVCGRRVRRGHVTEGPVLDGVRLFEGMNYHYSGYLHRAALMLDVDDAPADLIRKRRRKRDGGTKPDPDKRLLYLPELFIK